jgi:hypothetical protein
VKPSSEPGSPGIQVMIVAPPHWKKDRRSKVAGGVGGWGPGDLGARLRSHSSLRRGSPAAAPSNLQAAREAMIDPNQGGADPAGRADAEPSGPGRPATGAKVD